jgi:proline dehydrogenase
MHFFNNLAARAIPFLPRLLIQKMSHRYIAGDSLNLAVARIRQLNAQGFSATIDVLGEVAKNSAEVQRTVDEYAQVLIAISTHNLNATVSVKPTALGLLLNKKECFHHLECLITLAQTHQTAVCIDMEDVSCTQDEIEFFETLRVRHSNVSLALQAYLQRTYSDIERLTLGQSSLRICKGIYVEDKAHLVDGALKDRREINRHFFNHVKRCFETRTYVAIATHDDALIKQIITLAKNCNTAHSTFEFQMLLGVCEPLRDNLLAAGYKVCIYLPYGSDWYGYSTRRIKENPAIAGYILKAFWKRYA